MEGLSPSYREVLPDLSVSDEWTEITLNTGATQSTLQDIKVAEKAGGYCYQNMEQHHTRNRFIYWRSYQDVLELSEISLDFNLYQNNLRYKFTDSPVIAVSVTEQDQFVTVLVATVCSLHRMKFPHPNVLAEGSQTGSSNASTSDGSSSCFGTAQSFSIFRDANSGAIGKQNVFYVIDSHASSSNTSHNLMPHTAACYLAPNGEKAFFALAYQSQLMVYIMNCETGQTVSHPLKEHTIMPRLFSNIKGALIGKTDSSDAECTTSITFININDNIYLASLYRNDMLHIWSTSTFQSVCSLNCVREQHGTPRTQGPQSNAIRKINDRSLCVFLSHSNGAEFVCIEIHVDVGNSSGLSLVHRRVIAAPHLDLTDFEVSEKRIWALWSNAEGEFSVSNFSLSPGVGITHQWVSAAMEPPPDQFYVGNGQGMDSREAYCSYIFHPGRFDRSVISKALLMFRRTNVRFEAKHCSMTLLKEHVCQAIEEEIANELKDIDLPDEDYIDASCSLWERFYTGCEQYHMKACQPTGLLILQPVDGVCIVKKNTFSLLRPCEMLEHMMLAGDNIDIVTMSYSDNGSSDEDIAYLVGILSQIEKSLSEDTKLELDKKLYQLETPDELISKLSNEILSGTAENEMFAPNFLVEIEQKLQAINDIALAISRLLEHLRINNEVAEKMQTDLGVQSSRLLLNIGVLFGSSVGLTILSETIRQSAMIRFTVCRNLLLLQKMLIETYSLPVHVLEQMRSQFIPATITFLQSYYVMVWISETPVVFGDIAAAETSIQRLNMLQLTNASGRVYSTVGKAHAASLLRVFLNAKGLYTAMGLYADSYDPTSGWHNTLLRFNTIVSHLIWPVSYNFIFGEWLLGTCQHILIENYVRLLNSWCEENLCSRQFMLAVSFLDCGKVQKAYDLFLQSAKGVLIEPFLAQKILKNTNLPQRFEQLTATDDYSEAMCLSNQATVQLYLKVIQIFEEYNALDHVVSLAQAAVGLLEQDDPQLPMFQSIVFNNHLQLGHYEEAYHALIYNAESSRRKDCLRQLVLTLFSRRRVDLLMHFPYVGLYNEFENIVETRARSLRIQEGSYIYDFLYAFHVNNENLRKASAVMYEQAMRLQSEVRTIDAMRKRCDCLLICINAMHLIDERYNWIARPVIGEDYSCITNNSNNRIDDDNGNSNAQDVARINEKHGPEVIVLEIKDVNREWLHTKAVVLLSTKRPDVDTYLNAGPQEIASILASTGMFIDALKLVKEFDLNLLPIFESLTLSCIRISDEKSDESWLHENDIADLCHLSKAADVAWALMEKLIEEYEEPGSTVIRKCVVNKILSSNAFIPQWLMNSYKLDNCSELLHLFVIHSRLLEAAEFAQEMINAMLGLGSEYFSFKHPITITNPEMCLPLGTFDLLLHNLKLNSDDIEYKQALTELEELLHTYVKTAVRTADDKCQMAVEMEGERER